MTARKDDRINERRWRELLKRLGGGDQFDELISELVNSLQTAALLSTSLRRELGSSADVAVNLEGALGRAVRAVRRLQPGTDDE
jgi:hypothetical protein